MTNIELVKDDKGWKYRAYCKLSRAYTRRKSAIRAAACRFGVVNIITPISKRGTDRKLRKRKFQELAGKKGLEYFSTYNLLPHRRQKQIERIYRYIDEHPLTSNQCFEFLSKKLVVNERSRSLDAMIRDYDKNLYDFIDAKELNRHRELAEAI